MRKSWWPVAAVLGIGLVVVGFPRSRYVAGEDAAKPAYVGADGCKKCHFKQHGSWKKTEMARSLEKLMPDQAADKKKAAGLDPAVDYSKDAKCLKCHATGYGTDSGYPAVVAGKAFTADEEARAKLNAGVTCEACHGPGSLYGPYKKAHEDFKVADIVALGATVPPKAEQCMACHAKECPTMPKDYAFDFEKGKTSANVHEHFPLKKQH